MRGGAIAVAFILAIAAAAGAWRASANSAGLDFYQFWAGAQVVRAKPAINLYSIDTRIAAADEFRRRAADGSAAMRSAAVARPAFEFFSTPFLYATFSLFPSRYDAALLAYRIVLLALLVAGVLLAARAVRMGWGGALVLLAFVLTLYQPVASELRVLNVNGFQFAALAGALMLYERGANFAAAAILGAVVAFKPNVAPIVPLLLAYRAAVSDWRRLAIDAAGIASGALGGIAVGTAYFRSTAAWSQWTAAARELIATPLSIAEGNISLAARLGFSSTLLVATILGAIAIAFAFRSRRRDETPLVVGLGVAIYLLSATLVWFHYLILLLLLAIPLLVVESRWTRASAVIGLTLAGADLWTGLLHVRTLEGEATIAQLGIVILFAAGVARLGTRAEATP